MKTQVDSMDTAILDMQNRISQAENMLLRERVYELEKIARDLNFRDEEARRQNIIIQGILEAPYPKTKQVVSDLLAVLGVKVSSTTVNSIQRIGKMTEGKRKPRPIKVKFLSAISKQDLYRSINKLKDEEKWKFVSIGDDLTETKSSEQKDLRRIAAVAKANGIKALYRNSLLVIDDKKYTYAVRQAKAEFVCEKLEENQSDTKKFWNTISSILPGKNKSKQEVSLMENDIQIEKDNIPNFINGYFSNIEANLAGHFAEPEEGVNRVPECPNVLLPFLTNEVELLKLVTELNPVKSSAIGHLSTKVLKAAFSSQITRLVKVFNISFSKGHIPDCWKCASVVPLNKGGDLKEVNNFRPVSLLPIQGIG